MELKQWENWEIKAGSKGKFDIDVSTEVNGDNETRHAHRE
jgi:hypothetical protein